MYTFSFVWFFLSLCTKSPMVFFPATSSTVLVEKQTKERVQTVYNRLHFLSVVNTKRGPNLLKCIVLDPGHGGKDTGCRHNDYIEKDICLAIALKLRQELKRQFPELRIVMTREKDVFVPLYKRAQIANDAHADLFLSIHCNSAPQNKKARGSESYVLGLHRAQDNLDVAKRENESILLEENYQNFYGGFDPNAPESHILLSMFQNQYLEQSIVLADLIEKQMSTIRTSRGVKQAGFAVLRLTTMPSVLFESGFLSHQEEAALLGNDEHKKTIARLLCTAIERYCQQLYPDTRTRGSNDDAIAEQGGAKPTAPFYSIQLSNNIKPLQKIPESWLSLGTVFTVRTDRSTKYLLGKFKTKDEAAKLLHRIKSDFVPTAFITTIDPETQDLADIHN